MTRKQLRIIIQCQRPRTQRDIDRLAAISGYSSFEIMRIIEEIEKKLESKGSSSK